MPGERIVAKRFLDQIARSSPEGCTGGVMRGGFTPVTERCGRADPHRAVAERFLRMVFDGGPGDGG